jgi:hypothetical protein
MQTPVSAVPGAGVIGATAEATAPRPQLTRFQVLGLHGNRNLDVKFVDNTLIIVGENGSGKTTLLRLLYAFLSGRWLALAQYRFTTIIATIGEWQFTVSHETVSKAFEVAGKRIQRDLPPQIRRRVIELLERGQPERFPHELEMLSERYGFPVEVIMRQLEFIQDDPNGPQGRLQEQIKDLQRAMNAQILYLPTYRRIERELSSIMEGVDLTEARRNRQVLRQRESDPAYIELVEFGMKDVQEAIDRTLFHLKDFARETLNNLTLRYLGDVVNRAYDAVRGADLAGTSEQDVRTVLDRIQDNILNRDQKEHVLKVITESQDSEQDEHRKIILHYFRKIQLFQDGLKERERNISAFCALCSEYITDKKFVYDGANFSFQILPGGPAVGMKPVQLGDLSSGEKQIVSLFSHVYLSGRQNFFVIIDEPELSLSVPWQRRFLLDIRKGEYCRGLVAATHSPFVYENDLHSATHALGEFVV